MANALYTQARLGFFRGDFDLENDTITFALVSADYTPNLEADEFASTLGAAVVATVDLTGNTVSQDGAEAVFDGDDLTFTSVTGDQVLYIVGYQNTGNLATSRLIVFIDTAGNLPFTPIGGDFPVVWSATGIFTWTGC